MWLHLEKQKLRKKQKPTLVRALGPGPGPWALGPWSQALGPVQWSWALVPGPGPVLPYHHDPSLCCHTVTTHPCVAIPSRPIPVLPYRHDPPLCCHIGIPPFPWVVSPPPWGVFPPSLGGMSLAVAPVSTLFHHLGSGLDFQAPMVRACDMLVKETVPDLREHFKKELPAA